MSFLLHLLQVDAFLLTAVSNSVRPFDTNQIILPKVSQEGTRILQLINSTKINSYLTSAIIQKIQGIIIIQIT